MTCATSICTTSQGKQADSASLLLPLLPQPLLTPLPTAPTLVSSSTKPDCLHDMHPAARPTPSRLANAHAAWRSTTANTVRSSPLQMRAKGHTCWSPVTEQRRTRGPCPGAPSCEPPRAAGALWSHQASAGQRPAIARTSGLLPRAASPVRQPPTYGAWSAAGALNEIRACTHDETCTHTLPAPTGMPGYQLPLLRMRPLV